MKKETVKKEYDFCIECEECVPQGEELCPTCHYQKYVIDSEE